MRALLFVALGATGCGLGWTGDSSGGGDNLPTLGAGPYVRASVDSSTGASEPTVVRSQQLAYRDPACLARGGGGIRMWFGEVVDDVPPGTSTIGRAEVPSIHHVPDVGPGTVFSAAEPWEEERVAAPDVIEVDGDLLMFYEGGITAPAVGVARSSDGGATWTREGAGPVLLDATDPTVALVDGRYHLFVTRPGLEGIWRATTEDDRSLDFVLDPAPAIVPRPELDEAFDTLAVGAPFLRIQTSDTGRQQWSLWFTGTSIGEDDEEIAIGYAGSFDGQAWQRLGGADPMLSKQAGGPCVVLDGGEATLLFHQVERLRLAITAAVEP